MACGCDITTHSLWHFPAPQLSPTPCTRHTTAFSLPSACPLPTLAVISSAMTSEDSRLPPQPVLCKLPAFFKYIPLVVLANGLAFLAESNTTHLKQWKFSPAKGLWPPAPSLSWVCYASPQGPGSICCLAEEQPSPAEVRPWYRAWW